MDEAQPTPEAPPPALPRQCSNCEYGMPVRDQETGERVPARECRRMPPQVVLDGSQQLHSRWPVLSELEACGEYRQRFSWVDV